MESRKQDKRITPKSLYINLSKETKKPTEKFIYVEKRIRRGRRFYTIKQKKIIPNVKTMKMLTPKKSYIQRFPRYIANHKKEKHEREMKQIKEMKKQHQEIMDRRLQVNAAIVGIGQTSMYEEIHQNDNKETACIESTLPQFNLGDLFGLTQEKLYPKQRQSRHNKKVQIPNEIEEQVTNSSTEENEYEIVRESSLYVKKVFYMMINKGKEIGLTRECALVSLYYNNGIYPVQNISRRAAKFEKEMNSNPEFLLQIKVTYEIESEKIRKRKLAIEQYRAIESNIETLKKEIEMKKSQQKYYGRSIPISQRIRSVPVDGEIDRKYVNLKKGVYDNVDSCEKELEYLKQQFKTLISERKEELKEILMRNVTKTFVMNKQIIEENLLKNWKSIIEKRCEITSSDVDAIAKEYGMESEFSVSKEFIENALPEMKVNSILNLQNNFKVNEGNVAKIVIFEDVESMLQFDEIRQYLGIVTKEEYE